MATGTSQATDFGAAPEASTRVKPGLKIARYFSRPGVSPYDEIEWESPQRHHYQ